MKTAEAKQFYTTALQHVAIAHPDELEWARSVSAETFWNLDARGFLSEYCWVIYASGFRVSTVRAKFPALQEAYLNFDLEALATTGSADAAMEIINHAGKAAGFLRGARLIHDEGFDNFKARVKREGMAALRSLPYIGDITQKHLAKNIGLADVPKDDVWLVRLAYHFEAPTVEELTSWLAKEVEATQHVVDLVLWQYCADGMWTDADSKATVEVSTC